MSLVHLSSAFEAMRQRADRAEGQLRELQDLLCAFFRKNDQGAGDWLRIVAELQAEDYEARRATADNEVIAVHEYEPRELGFEGKVQ